MGQVWFGTKEYMQWIPAPAVDVVAGKTGYAASANFIGGGAWVRRSKSAAKKFAFSWNMKHRADIQAVLDYADGIYGNGYIYYSNPFSMDRNVLPSYWATPFINAYDGPAIVNGIRPDLVTGSGIINGYPLESATYTLTTTDSIPSIYVPIPPGYTAYVGAAGEVLTGDIDVTVMSHSTPAGGPTAALALLGKTDPITNETVDGDSYQGLTISMDVTTNGTIRLDGLTVQVLPTGSVAPSNEFVSGQGQSGMSFVSQPVTNEYSAAMDRVGVSVEMIEVEGFQWQ